MPQPMRARDAETQRCLLNTDWMGLSLRIDTPVKKAPRGYMWREYANGTNVWQMRRILYTERGDKVCTLLSEPKSRIINPHAGLLEIENEWLYHGIGVRGIEDVLRECMIYKVTGMSRMDLAVDFVPTESQYETICALSDGSAYVQGKRCGSGFWSVSRDGWLPRQYAGQRIPHCISWGHKTSDVKWKCYYKSKELKDAVGGLGWDKPYIVDQWREAGFDVTNVWRLEVSIHNCNSVMYNGKPLTQDVWGNATVALMRDFYTSRFVVRKNQGHKDRSNDDIVEFLPIEGHGLVRCRTYDGEREHHGRITLLRKLVQSLDDEQVLLDGESREGVFEHISAIIRRDGLQNYFRGMVGDYFEVWRDKVREEAGVTETVPGKYNILREKHVGLGMRQNAGFDDVMEEHEPAEVKLPDVVTNWRKLRKNDEIYNPKFF